MRVGDSGPWTPMTRSLGRADPYYLALKARETAGPTPPPGLPLPSATACQHLWQATLPIDIAPGAHTIQVRATDTFGRTHFDRRVLQITA